MRGLHHIFDNSSCLLQVKDLLIPPLLVAVQLLDGVHVLNKLFVSPIQLLFDGFLVLFEICI